ncbi:MAG: hypothetical protein KAW12_16960 [Candidatus Aminicenantes bacterium]|nr:hypothetical protein [Candidatus Aminicenantes bacterium]
MKNRNQNKTGSILLFYVQANNVHRAAARTYRRRETLIYQRSTITARNYHVT